MTAPARERRSRRHRPWWRGGSSVRRWNSEVLGWAALGLGTALLAGFALGSLVGPTWGTAALWVALIVPVVFAFRRGVPRGLLAFRAVDLLYAVVLGSAVRLVQGWLAGPGPMPTYPTLDGSLPPLWWADELLAGGVVAPVVEEFFFRGMLLVALFTVVRRMLRRPASEGILPAGVIAVVVTAGLFVLAHQLVSPVTIDVALSLSVLGLVTGSLVMFTGRIWPAVLVHVVYNLTGVGLTVLGTLLG